MDAGALVVIQADIAVDAPAVGQVNVVAFVQLEGPIDQRGVLGEELHTDTPTSEGGIHSQINPLFLACVEVLQQKLRLAIADVSIQVYLEGFLVLFGVADDLGQEAQAIIAMFQIQADRVEREAVGTHTINICLAVDALFGRSIKVHIKTVERDSLHSTEVVGNRVIVAGLGFQADAWKEGFQFFLNHGACGPLLIGTGGEGIELRHQGFHIATSFEVHVQVTGTHIGTGGVGRSGKARIQVFGLERFLGSLDVCVRQRGIHLVFLQEVAHEGHIQMMRSRERHFHQPHRVPVELGNL